MNTIDIAHHWMQHWIHENNCCIDATAGRGNDTVFLCQLVGKKGKVIAFDIQKEALESTKNRLIEKDCQAQLYLDSHVHMGKYVETESVDGIMFNFGYLPKGDHAICTKKETSIQAIQVGLDLLKHKGVMSLCVYHGGDTGFEEKEGILNFVKGLNPKHFTVMVSEFYNQMNYPPIFVGIVKK